jgi:hypothetical protein
MRVYSGMPLLRTLAFDHRSAVAEALSSLHSASASAGRPDADDRARKRRISVPRGIQAKAKAPGERSAGG